MNRQALTDTLIQAEGLRLFPYVDTVGKLTIGVGRNLTDVGISHSEAMALLEHDIDRAIQDVSRRWPPYAGLNDVRQQAVIEMGFNLGVGGLMLFKHTLAALATGAYHIAADQARASAWYKQVGARGERIAKMLETGEVPL